MKSNNSDWHLCTEDQSPLADAEWVRCFSDAFGASPTMHEVYRAERLIATVPLQRAVGLARAWTSVDNEHTPYWPISDELALRDARSLLAHLLDDADYVFLRRLPIESAACKSLIEAAAQMELPVALIESGAGDARMALAGSWDEFRTRLPKNFLRDLPRKQRQLERSGRLELARFATPGAELAHALEECFALEARGWKGTSGSPILSDPRTLRFYTELAQASAARCRFALYALRMSGRIIAFEYCLRGGGHIEMLKLSYDPDLAAHSPGHVLRMMLLRHELELGEIRYYHLGRPSEWKLRWASEIGALCTLRIYAPTLRGRLAHRLGPVLRSQIKRWPPVAHIRARLRHA